MAGAIYEDVDSFELSEVDGEEHVEKMVDIYVSADAVKSTNIETGIPQTAGRRGSRCYRLAAVCVILQCVLLLTVNILLYVHYVQKSTAKDRTMSSLSNKDLTEERDQLKKLTEERDQLKNSTKDLIEERNQLKNSNKDLTEERDQLKDSYKNLTEERDQLKNSNKDLTEERDQLKKLTEERDQLKNSTKDLIEERNQLKNSNKDLTEERDQLKISNKNLTEERDQLEISYQTLTGERDQLKNRAKDLTEENLILQSKYDHLLQQIEWKKFGSSFYFFSTEQKTWSDARKDCRERGADLVIINNVEEQKFLIDQEKQKNDFWIGLTDQYTESVWKWVDGQKLTHKFWKPNEPNNAGGQENCAAFSAPGESFLWAWNDLPCSETENWVCELNFTKNQPRV
ncbi:asialoglycoprotein receptor 1-like [Astyanax mexicanus]|uniref:Asialoglycoprotein receptor 1-like n=1 Tax=Astyanax mexicanus TaxID=7994 RepID=A0A8T2KL59_ASTMX|nr:asialoglycoprotein receptor 1-like [Astyanax mexicanus]